MKWKIACEVELPDGSTWDDVYEWARFRLGENGCLSGKNPLKDFDVEAVFPSVEVEEA